MDWWLNKLVRVAVLVVGALGLAALPTLVSAAALYKLPYPAGMSSIVTLAPGVGGHTGMQAHATDFAMPLGSTIVATRSGRVKLVKENSNVCGCSSSFGNSANYVVIDHGDGTQALYLHLQYNGALVNVGDQVQQGQPIAKSGMTGWTCGSGPGGCGPHLHYQVERNGIWFTSSVPSSFADIATNGGVPQSGRSYVSGNQASSTSPPDPPAPPPQGGCTGVTCNGQNAAETSCGADARTVAAQDVTFGSGGSATSLRVEVRWSESCQSNWARTVTVASPSGATPMTLAVELRDHAGQSLPGTSATGQGATVHGAMWFAPALQVKSCVAISGRHEGLVCTKAI